MDGKHTGSKLDLDDYILGALILYIDIIHLFLKILRLLAAINRNKWYLKKNYKNL